MVYKQTSITRENSSHSVKSLHTGIKRNEEAAKQAIGIPKMTTPYTEYYLTIGRAKNSEWERKKQH